jgi:hypothetical protein
MQLWSFLGLPIPHLGGATSNLRPGGFQRQLTSLRAFNIRCKAMPDVAEVASATTRMEMSAVPGWSSTSQSAQTVTAGSARQGQEDSSDLPSSTSPALKFEVLARQGRARTARMTLPHYVCETPMFMPVGTQGEMDDSAVALPTQLPSRLQTDR